MSVRPTATIAGCVHQFERLPDNPPIPYRCTRCRGTALARDVLWFEAGVAAAKAQEAARRG